MRGPSVSRFCCASWSQICSITPSPIRRRAAASRFAHRGATANPCSKSKTTGRGYLRLSAKRFSSAFTGWLPREAKVADSDCPSSRRSRSSTTGGSISPRRRAAAARRSALSFPALRHSPRASSPRLLPKRLPCHDEARLRRRRPEFARLADARHRNELLAAVNEGQAVAAPRRNAALLKQILQRAPRPARIRPQSLSAPPHAHGDRRLTQFRQAQPAPFFRFELQHSSEREQRQRVLAVPAVAEIRSDVFSCRLEVQLAPVAKKIPAGHRQADAGVCPGLAQL